MWLLTPKISCTMTSARRGAPSARRGRWQALAVGRRSPNVVPTGLPPSFCRTGSACEPSCPLSTPRSIVTRRARHGGGRRRRARHCAPRRSNQNTRSAPNDWWRSSPHRSVRARRPPLTEGGHIDGRLPPRSRPCLPPRAAAAVLVQPRPAAACDGGARPRRHRRDAALQRLLSDRLQRRRPQGRRAAALCGRALAPRARAPGPGGRRLLPRDLPRASRPGCRTSGRFGR